MQEEGRVIGVRNNDGRTEEATEIGGGRCCKEEDAGVAAAAAYGQGGVGGCKRRRWERIASRQKAPGYGG